MAESAPSFIVDPMLPSEGSAVTLQGIDTGAIQSLTLDGIYRVSAYDPALQTPEVAARYAAYPPERMAAILLRGVDCLPSLQEAEPHSEASGPEKPYREQLQDDISLAAGELVTCFNIGLLQADYLPASNRQPVVFDSAQTKALETIVDERLTGQTPDEILQTLTELEQTYGAAEGKLLPLLVKAYALRYLQPKNLDTQIRQAMPKVKTYEFNSKTGATLQAVKDTFDDVDYQYKAAVPIGPQGLQERREFIDSIADRMDLSYTEGPRTVQMKDATLTFDFKDVLSGRLSVMAALYICGLDNPEMMQALGCGLSTVKSRLNNVRKALNLDDTTNLTLYAIEQGYLTFDRPLKLHDPDLAHSSLKLLRRLIEEGESIRKISDTFESPGTAYPHIRHIAHQTYNDLGVTSEREATLVAASHRLLRMPYKEELKEELPSFNEVMLTTICREPGCRTILINGAEVTYDFPDFLTRKQGAVGILMSLGVPTIVILEHLRSVNFGISTFYELRETGDFLGIHNKDRTTFVLDIYRQFVAKLDLSGYKKPTYAPSAGELQILNLLSKYTRDEVRNQADLTKPALDRRIRKLREKLAAENDTLLIWTALFCGYIQDIDALKQ